MAVNKVIYGGNTLVDLTGDTVTAADLADGVKATGADGNPVIGLMQKVTIDAELSTTSTNPVQNRVIKEALDTKLGKTETAYAATKATQDGEGNTIATTYIKFINGNGPDASGNVNVSAGGGGGVSTSVANTWTAQQNFYDLMLSQEKYTTNAVNGTFDIPITSTMLYTAVGAFTLNLANLVGALSAGQSSVFTAYFAANADYSLTITDAGTLKYVGNASDVAITSAGLLLNIMMLKDVSGNVTSIVQSSKLEGGA